MGIFKKNLLILLFYLTSYKWSNHSISKFEGFSDNQIGNHKE